MVRGLGCYCIRRCGTGTLLNFYVEPQKAWYGVSALARSVGYLLIGVAATALLGAIWMIVLSVRARVQEDRESRHQRERDTTSPNRSVPETAPGGSPKSSPAHSRMAPRTMPRRLSDHDRASDQEVSAITDVATSSITCSR